VDSITVVLLHNTSSSVGTRCCFDCNKCIAIKISVMSRCRKKCGDDVVTGNSSTRVKASYSARVAATPTALTDGLRAGSTAVIAAAGVYVGTVL
jgi:hypothetical protein